MRDQAADAEKGLLFGDLITGLARNGHSKISRSTRREWKPLLEGFMIHYVRHGVSTSRQYYHGRKRSDETPLEYRYRLYVAAFREKISIREGGPAMRHEHVEHFIEMLEDRDLAKQSTLLRLMDT